MINAPITPREVKCPADLERADIGLFSVRNKCVAVVEKNLAQLDLIIEDLIAAVD
jgi:hypothetical protein